MQRDRFKLRCSPELLLARLLAMLRKASALTQADLAGRLAVSAATVAAWEANRCSVTVAMLDEIAGVLGVPGLLLHALHAQAVNDLERAGCPVSPASWRRPRGTNARPPERQAEGTEIAATQLDEWLDDWINSTPLPAAALQCSEEGTIIQADVPWSPAPVEQRLGRIDRTGEHRIITLQLGRLPARESALPEGEALPSLRVDPTPS